MPKSTAITPRKTKPKVEDLTEKQRVFCHEWIKDFNGTRAAEVAGYTSPNSQSTRILNRKPVQKYLGHLVQERMWRCEIEADRVLRELMSIAFFNPLDMFDESGVMIELTKLPREVAAAIRSIKVSYGEDLEQDGVFSQVKHIDIQFHDKLNAINLIMRHLGMLDDRLKVDHGLDLSGLLPQLLAKVEAAEQDQIVDGNVIKQKALEHDS